MSKTLKKDALRHPSPLARAALAWNGLIMSDNVSNKHNRYNVTVPQGTGSSRKTTALWHSSPMSYTFKLIEKNRQQYNFVNISDCKACIPPEPEPTRVGV